MGYKLPDRPRKDTAPSLDESRARLERLQRERAARIQAGKDGKN